MPGWPVGFGDEDKAQQLLQQALKLNPNGIDGLYFWGDYLYRQDKFAEARQALLKARQAPARPGRELADQGRQGEIDSLLKTVEEELQ
ncbi:Tetratricopeptide repeat protein [compost metagenome]